MRVDRAEATGIAPLAEIVAHGMCAERFAYLHTVPAIALQRALKKAGTDFDEPGLIEINEAFASVALHSTLMLGGRREPGKRLAAPNGRRHDWPERQTGNWDDVMGSAE